MADPRPPHADPDLTVHVDGARAVAHPTRHGWEVDIAVASGRLDVPVTTRLLRDVADEVGAAGGGTVRWRVPVATPEHVRAADAAGFDGRRRLVQLRRPLPAPDPEPPLATRAFVPGRDDAEWLRVNNAAFSWHPEQSDWTEAVLHRTLTEPWVDLEGILLHPSEPGGGAGGPIDGFCWTKVHRELDPEIGEIFVIAVDPASTGRGLGRRLVLAGLAHLAAQGLGEAMLYTEADNAAAMALYDALEFRLHHEVRVFTRVVDTAAVRPR